MPGYLLCNDENAGNLSTLTPGFAEYDVDRYGCEIVKNGDDHPLASPHCRSASCNRYPDRIKGSFYSGGRSVSHQGAKERWARLYRYLFGE